MRTGIKVPGSIFSLVLTSFGITNWPLEDIFIDNISYLLLDLTNYNVRPIERQDELTNSFQKLFRASKKRSERVYNSAQPGRLAPITMAQ